MKRVVFILALAMATTRLVAQSASADYSLKWIAEEKSASSGSIIVLIDGDNKYLLKANGGVMKDLDDYSLIRYDKDDIQQAENNLNFLDGKNKFIVTHVFAAGNQLYGLAYLNGGAFQSKYDTYLFSIDKSTLAKTGEAIKLSDGEGENLWSAFHNSIAVSKNGKMFAVYSDPYSEKSTAFGIKMFNATGALVWKRDFPLPIEEPKFNVLQGLADDNGSFYLIAISKHLNPQALKCTLLEMERRKLKKLAWQLRVILPEVYMDNLTIKERSI